MATFGQKINIIADSELILNYKHSKEEFNQLYRILNLGTGHAVDNYVASIKKNIHYDPFEHKDKVVIEQPLRENNKADDEKLGDNLKGIIDAGGESLKNFLNL